MMTSINTCLYSATEAGRELTSRHVDICETEHFTAVFRYGLKGPVYRMQEDILADMEYDKYVFFSV